MESFLKVKRKGEKGKLLLFLFAFLVCFAGNLFGQDFSYWTEQIKNGSAESKRSVLYQICNFQTAEASRIAILALQDSDEIVRATAAFSVIYIPSEEAVQVLLPNLKDKFPFVRQETALALGKTKNFVAVKPLLEILQKDKSFEVKTSAAIALGEIGDISAVEFLLKILQRKPNEEEDFLRRSAARSIGQIAQIQQVKTAYVVTPESLLGEKDDVLVNLKYSNLAEKIRFSLKQTKFFCLSCKIKKNRMMSVVKPLLH